MAGSPYASALGRLKVDFTSFLPKETYASLVAAKDPIEIAKILEATPYGAELSRARTTSQGSQLLEIAINRTLIRRDHHAFEATPFAGRELVAAYLNRWDIQNIALVLSAKVEDRLVADTEDLLVSSREIPAGMIGGVLTLDDYRLLLQQPNVEAVVAGLVRFGYGQVLLPLLDAYSRSHDIFPLLQVLDREYYRRLFAAARFFQGDEWVVHHFLQSEVDVRNALLLLKGKSLEQPLDVVLERFIDGGMLPKSSVSDLYSARTVPELVESLEGRYPSIGEGSAAYQEHQSLTGYETTLVRDRAVTELKRLRAYPLSVGVIFTYLLLAELERADLRRIVFGRLYGVAPERIEPLLVSPRL